MLALAISLLLLSCQKTPLRGAEVNYKQGFLDVDVSSLANKEEYQGRELELPVLVQNTLAYDLENAVVSVVGFDNHYVELYSDRTEIPSLEGKSIFNPLGGEERVEFNGLIKQLLPGAVKEAQNYRIYVKYDSKVEFSPSICVTSQLSGYESYEGGCAFQQEISYNGQGAPLGVTNLEIIPRQGREVELRLSVENKGKGKVGRVSLASATLGGKPMVCDFRGVEEQGAGLFSFASEQKSAKLLCTGFLTSESSYQTTLFVELWYDYEMNVKEQLVILE